MSAPHLDLLGITPWYVVWEGGESEHVPLKERMMDEGRRGIVLRPSSTASTASLGRSDDDEDRSK